VDPLDGETTPPGSSGSPGRTPSLGKRQALRFALGTVVAAAALWLVVSAAGGLGDALDALRRTDAVWLVPAIAFEAVSYVLSAARLRALAGPEAALSMVEATELSLVAHGLGLLTPASPAEGIAFEYRELSQRGLARRRIALTIGFEQWFSTRVFYLVHALNLLVIVATRDFPTDTKWPLLAAALILSLLVTTAIAAARPQVAQRIAVVVGGLRFWRPRPSRDDRSASGARLHADAMAVVGPPRRRARIAMVSAASVLADAACFWMLLFAVGIHDGFELALLSVGAAAVASSIPLLPGGLGAVEAAVPALLAWYGAPVAAALSATLLYRAIGTFLPAAAGALSIPALRVSTRRDRTDGRGRTEG
jgi:uncharacterized protein (TIRG00374 family)